MFICKWNLRFDEHYIFEIYKIQTSLQSSQSKNFHILSNLLEFYFTSLSQKINFDCFFFRNFANCTQVRDFSSQNSSTNQQEKIRLKQHFCHFFRISLGSMILYTSLENVIIRLLLLHVLISQVSISISAGIFVRMFNRSQNSLLNNKQVSIRESSLRKL